MMANAVKYFMVVFHVLCTAGSVFPFIKGIQVDSYHMMGVMGFGIICLGIAGIIQAIQDKK